MSEEEQEEEKVHTIDDVLDAALEAGFTNVNDLRAFTRIARGDEPYRHDIIKAVGCDYQAASQIVKRLNKMGLVEEFKEERTRLRLLKLTRGGAGAGGADAVRDGVRAGGWGGPGRGGERVGVCG